MRNALSNFRLNIRTARESDALYEYLTQTIVGPHNFDDLLRFQLVYAVSAFDKLLHDLVRIGMTASFVGARPPTAKYHAESISIQLHGELVGATIPPREYLFEQEVIRKLRFQSFQDPDKAADGLSLIWNESQKWQKIGEKLRIDGNVAKTRLKLISIRRNAIVHESDIDPITETKNSISRQEASDVTLFLEDCGSAITDLVI